MSYAYNNMVLNIANRSAGRLTDKLHELASEAGWSEQAVNAVSVRVSDGDLEIHIEPELKSLVDSFEYGTPKRPPMAVIRKFTPRIPEYIKDIISSELVGNLDNLLESL